MAIYMTQVVINTGDLNTVLNSQGEPIMVTPEYLQALLQNCLGPAEDYSGASISVGKPMAMAPADMKAEIPEE